MEFKDLKTDLNVKLETRNKTCKKIVKRGYLYRICKTCGSGIKYDVSTLNGHTSPNAADIIFDNKFLRLTVSIRRNNLRFAVAEDDTSYPESHFIVDENNNFCIRQGFLCKSCDEKLKDFETYGCRVKKVKEKKRYKI